ncbi:hypothetical protein O181_091256 [Austropuccinia psidii MF-1]|uniref:CCHC-type domain-containing protein n=1 Tax=Austropuccinia psidii MF-1 TaxID=1389203 RepID=A0A9Q3P9H1_9BASI|nr:hypothetical protein [Austropuccinia psidii MF-1]
MLQRRVYQCTRRRSDKNKNWQKMEKIGHSKSKKTFIKKDKKEPFKTNTPNTHEQRKCHKCGGIGYLANNCLKKAKINEIVEKEDQNDKKYESESEKDTEERPAYPASPRVREALEVHIKELMDLVVLRKVRHNEKVEVTTPVIIAYNNGKSRMVGDFRALNTYTIPDRYLSQGLLEEEGLALRNQELTWRAPKIKE